MRCHAPTADLLEQRLRNNRVQRLGQHRANHRLFLRREHIDDPVDGLGRRGGVQRAKYQVAGFGSSQRQTNGLQVTHFADQNHIRVLTQGRAQRFGKPQRVTVHLALVDKALLGLVNEFDRVFDGQDMVMLVAVEVVDHRRQGRRLA